MKLVRSGNYIRYNLHVMTIEDDAADRGAEGASMLEIPSRPTYLGPLAIRRALPVREKRTVGPWCFLDRYGPLTFSNSRPMDVGAHPHIGIQTVSWLFDGEVEHFDSLGFNAIVRPGGVNVMTAGSGIAHAERTPDVNRGRLDGVQLWVALPDDHRNVAATFEHAAEVPQVDLGEGEAKIFAGAWAGATAPVTAFSAFVGAEIVCHPGGTLAIPLDSAFEHGLFVVSGDPEAAGRRLAPNMLYALAAGSTEIELCAREGARLLLIGGSPLTAPILMWWNFVARTREEIAVAQHAWNSGSGFGEVAGHSGPCMPAPPLGWRPVATTGS